MGSPTKEVTATSPVDSRVDDPNFLLCVALCYLGLPPGMWRIVVNAMLEALSAEYRATRTEAQASKDFEEFRLVFQSWSAFSKFKAVIVFLGESRIGIIPVKAAAATAARERILALLARAGIKASAITGASQIIRKVNIYLELAWLTGCAAYCGAIGCAQAIILFSVAATNAVIEFAQIAGHVTNAVVSAVFLRPVLVARAMMDPSNWDTSPLGSSALCLRLLGNSLWSKLQVDNADAFLANLVKPMSAFNFPQAAIDEIATAMTTTVNARGGMQAAFAFPSSLLLELYPLSFVQMLTEWKLLRYLRDPLDSVDGPA